jgi:hypothetical protein
MRIESRVNQYQGINAHYQSHAQNTENGWKSFHSMYIAQLAIHTERQLPPGYRVAPEQSLQLRLVDPLSGDDVSRHRPKPDVTLFEHQGRLSSSSQQAEDMAAIASPVATLPAEMLGFKEDELTAVLIYRVETGHTFPVARLELLSPGNKTGQELGSYLAKRKLALEAGTVLVELDYLHQTNNVLAQHRDDLSGYARFDPGAFPYSVMVTDPRPSLPEGRLQFYGFWVDEALLPVEIPLLAGDVVQLDFLAVYRQTFEQLAWYYAAVDYAREPRAFHTYHPADQGRIWARMLAVIDAVRTGQDLDDGPFPIRSDDPTLQALMRAGYQAAALLLADDLSSMGWLLLRGEGEAARLEWWERGHLAGQAIAAGEHLTLQERFSELHTRYDEAGFGAVAAALSG